MNQTSLGICRDLTIVDRGEIRTPFDDDLDGVFIVAGCLILALAIAVYSWWYV